MTGRTLLAAVGATLLLAAAPASAGGLRLPLDDDDDPGTWACAGIDILGALCVDNPLHDLPRVGDLIPRP